jgi:hypothetical protein
VEEDKDEEEEEEEEKRPMVGEGWGEVEREETAEEEAEEVEEERVSSLEAISCTRMDGSCEGR